MDDPEIITATEASRSFSELLHRVCYGGESFTVKKGNRLMARIVPVEPIEKIAEAVQETQAEKIPPAQMTKEEAEFYQAWMEQVQKVEA